MAEEHKKEHLATEHHVHHHTHTHHHVPGEHHHVHHHGAEGESKMKASEKMYDKKPRGEMGAAKTSEEM